MSSQRRRRSVVLTLAVAVVLGACGSARTASAVPLDRGSAVPDSLEGLSVTTVSFGAIELDVAVAETVEDRAAGLTGVEDLGALDGLLFVFPAAVDTRITMRGVPIALDIAFIDADGRVLTIESMAVCDTEPCPSYASPSPYRWAIETPAGGLAGVEPGDRFAVQP